jgi:hypothetical protein
VPDFTHFSLVVCAQGWRGGYARIDEIPAGRQFNEESGFRAAGMTACNPLSGCIIRRKVL